MSRSFDLWRWSLGRLFSQCGNVFGKKRGKIGGAKAGGAVAFEDVADARVDQRRRLVEARLRWG
jgi:hypothetical protein